METADVPPTDVLRVLRDGPSSSPSDFSPYSPDSLHSIIYTTYITCWPDSPDIRSAAAGRLRRRGTVSRPQGSGARFEGSAARDASKHAPWHLSIRCAPRHGIARPQGTYKMGRWPYLYTTRLPTPRHPAPGYSRHRNYVHIDRTAAVRSSVYCLPIPTIIPIQSVSERSGTFSAGADCRCIAVNVDVGRTPTGTTGRRSLRILPAPLVGKSTEE